MPIKLPGDESGVPHMSAEAFDAAGRDVLAMLVGYWQGLGARAGQLDAPAGANAQSTSRGAPERLATRLPVRSRVRPGELLAALPAHAPEVPEPWADVLNDVQRMLVPALTHWQSPDFYAYFPANASAPAVLGELLSAGLGVNGMLWATSPAATELETRVLDWLREALDLPEAFDSRANFAAGGGAGIGAGLVAGIATGGGVIQGTASEATLCALLAARQRWRAAGKPGVPTLYTSEQAHSSVLKAAMIAGLAESADDRTHLRLVPAGPDHALDTGALARLVAQDVREGRTPMFCCATLGSTGTMAFDDLTRIASVLDAADGTPRPWLHVDAALAGAAWICPELRARCAGVARADSLCFNPHKWLLVNFDCDVLWTSDKAALIGALSVTPEYLRTGQSAGEVIDYRDWGVPLGRRFRALKLWLVLRHYGLSGLRGYIREHLRLAGLAQELIGACPWLEVCAPRDPSSPLVVFAMAPRAGETPVQADARSRALLESLNASGRMLLSHTTLPRADPRRPGAFVLRLCVGSTLASELHVRAACDEIARVAAIMGA